MAQSAGNAKNILVGASPLFITNLDVTDDSYKEGFFPGEGSTPAAPGFEAGESYTKTLNDVDWTEAKDSGAGKALMYRNVGFTNNGLQITYNPTYDSVTVDQLLDTAKLFKSAMEVMIATEMSEGTLQNVLVVFGQKASTLTPGANRDVLGLAGGALGEAPTERQLVAVGQAPTASSTGTERVYYARRVLSVQQSQFSLARTTPTTFPVTFRLLPDASKADKEYGLIIDRVIASDATA